MEENPQVEELAKEYTSKINTITKEQKEVHYEYTLYKVTETDGERTYAQNSSIMSREEFEQHRDDLEMEYMQYSGEQCMRHTKDKSGQEWCYVEDKRNIPCDYTLQEQFFEDFLEQSATMLGINQYEAYKEFAQEYKSLGFRLKGTYRLDDLIDDLFERPELLKILRKV